MAPTDRSPAAVGRWPVNTAAVNGRSVWGSMPTIRPRRRPDILHHHARHRNPVVDWRWAALSLAALTVALLQTAVVPVLGSSHISQGVPAAVSWAVTANLLAAAAATP